MKVKQKITISSLLVVANVALIGSISNTVAWFQLSLRAQTSFSGTNVYCTRLLTMSCDNGETWSTLFTSEKIKENSIGGESFEPVTAGPLGKNDDLTTIYAQPQYQQGLYTNWYEADQNDYATFTLLVKVNEENIDSTEYTNDVYLKTLVMRDTEGHELTNAVRVHLKAEGTTTNYFLFAKKDTSIIVGGNLDINNNGLLDVADGMDELGGSNPTLCMYGGTGLTQQSYLSNDELFFPSEVDGDLVGGTPIGTTTETVVLEVTVTIWLEGWSILAEGSSGNANGENSSIWDKDTYKSNTFYVGMEFGIKSHSD